MTYFRSYHLLGTWYNHWFNDQRVRFPSRWIEHRLLQPGKGQIKLMCEGREMETIGYGGWVLLKGVWYYSWTHTSPSRRWKILNFGNWTDYKNQVNSLRVCSMVCMSRMKFGGLKAWAWESSRQDIESSPACHVPDVWLDQHCPSVKQR